MVLLISRGKGTFEVRRTKWRVAFNWSRFQSNRLLDFCGFSMMLVERVFIVMVDGILYRVVLFEQFMFIKIREILYSNIV